MLTIVVPGQESFNDDTETFETTESVTVEFEHSLVSLSKWESVFKKPFLSKTAMTSDEAIAYIRMMVLTPDVPDQVLFRLTDEQIAEITSYIDSQQTATTFHNVPNRPNHEVITAEVIYYWMTSMSIPPEYQYWHLSRLITLLKVSSLKQQKPKKMPKADAAAERARLNAERRAALGSMG